MRSRIYGGIADHGTHDLADIGVGEIERHLAARRDHDSRRTAGTGARRRGEPEMDDRRWNVDGRNGVGLNGLR